MVVICNKLYSEHFNDTNNSMTEEFKNEIREKFSKYPFELSDFQKYALTGIVEGNHVLITAHTGSGKTLPAEFAIEHFHNKGKKVIYTSPIKALSNQKFHEFTEKFPNISIGILTGDIKFNPEADVLIMTTEILQNTLYQKQQNIDVSNLHFNIDITNELGCVVFDEVHYINDQDRGKVWEESIIMLPEHVQILMLSATIDRSESFAEWVESRYDKSDKSKKVYLSSTNHRVVPLTHYVYMVTPDGFYKHEKDKTIQSMVREYSGDFHVIRDSNGKFNADVADKTRKILQMIEKKQVRVKNEFVLESIFRFLKQKHMLPAICFVFSRKNVEKFALSIKQTLFPEDSKIPNIIEDECKNILRKLPNYNEYIVLPEFKFILSCLQRGIAVHHSGIIPVFREMIELLFSKGYILALFATETFAVGINMPTKTVLFTSLNKYTDCGKRNLLSHEYTQMAGRAGRRGLDTVGNVIHLNNMFWGSTSYPDNVSYKSILSGTPQTLKSKFSINFGIILNMVQMGIENYDTYAQKSMLSDEIKKGFNGIEKDINIENENLKKFTLNNSDIEKLQVYTRLNSEMMMVNGNKKKKLYNTLNKLVVDIGDFDKKRKEYADYIKVKLCLDELKQRRNVLITYIEQSVLMVLKYLEKYNFIEKDIELNKMKITRKGKVATFLHEVPSLCMAEIFNTPWFQELSSKEIVSFLSCFTNIRVSNDDKKAYNVSTICGDRLKEVIPMFRSIIQEQQHRERTMGLTLSYKDELQLDIMDDVMKWYDCNDENECFELLNKIKEEKEIFPGEFVKALLKINNVCLELQNVCEYLGEIEMLHKLKEIPEKILKYVATNQSLYI